MEDPFEKMDEMLRSWNLPQLCATFREQEVVPDALDALTEADIEALIPKLGPRALFRKRLTEWLQGEQQAQEIDMNAQVEKQNLYTFIDEDDNEVEVLNDHLLNDETNSEEYVIEEEIHFENENEEYLNDDDEQIFEITKNICAEQPEPEAKRFKSEKVETAVERSKRLVDNKTMLNKTTRKIKKETAAQIIEIENSSNDRTTVENVGQVEESIESENEAEISIQPTTTRRRCQRIGRNWAGLNVKELLLGTEAGRSLLEKYESEPFLEKRTRYYIADIIITEIFAKNLIMDRFKFDNIANQIIELFPTEDKESWYLPNKTKKGSGGTLYYKYYATYTKMRKSGFYEHYIDSVEKHFDSDASLQAEIENGNYPIKFDETDNKSESLPFKRAIPRYERIRSSSDFQRIDVRQVLESSYEGLALIDFYEKSGSLDVSTRNRLCKLVCLEGINRNIKMQPVNFYDVTCQIIEIFPKEKHETFFFPRGKTPPKGCLYHKYIYLTRRIKKIGLEKDFSIKCE